MNVEIGRDITMTVPDHGDNDLLAQIANHVWYIGWRNIMDAHAGAAKIAESGGDVHEIARAMAEKKLAAMLAGDLRSSPGGGRTSDPVRREAIALATADIRASWTSNPKNKGKKWADVDAKRVRETAKALIGDPARNYMVRARARVDELNAATTTVDVDLD